VFNIVFISYQEPNADANWADLKARFPAALRLHGVNGIHNAHKEAATRLNDQLQSMMAVTSNDLNYLKFNHFWVVDGDSTVSTNFTFEPPKDIWEDAVYVYRAENPVNGLSYGYGGIKLLPVVATANMPLGNVDMTTSISKNFFPMDQIASTTNFNTDPFNAWKSAFRECVKLSSRVIDGQIDTETKNRLDTWCNKWLGDSVPNVVWAVEGARDGKAYGVENAGNVEELKKINDFEWLQNKFKEYYD
jgi:hypothetical protein